MCVGKNINENKKNDEMEDENDEPLYESRIDHFLMFLDRKNAIARSLSVSVEFCLSNLSLIKDVKHFLRMFNLISPVSWTVLR